MNNDNNSVTAIIVMPNTSVEVPKFPIYSTYLDKVSNQLLYTVDDGHAIVYYSDPTYETKHRVDGAAIVFHDRSEIHFLQYNRYHRDDGPAYQKSFDRSVVLMWCLDGEIVAQTDTFFVPRKFVEAAIARQNKIQSLKNSLFGES